MSEKQRQRPGVVSQCYEPEVDEACDACDGTGYAPNCGPRDRERGDMWDCWFCYGTGRNDTVAVNDDA